MNLSAILFSIVLFVAAVVLVWINIRTWRRHQGQELVPEDYRYRHSQFRRRIQISVMIGLLGAAIFVGDMLLTAKQGSSLFFALYWLGVTLVTCWVLLLAGLDILATSIHFGRKRDRCLVEQAVLDAQARRIRAIRGNGHASSEDIGKKNPK